MSYSNAMHACKEEKGHKKKIIIALILIIVLLLGIIGSIMKMKTATVNYPVPYIVESVDEKDDDGFEKVDWDKWKKINPDVCGWIQIPGTQVNYPIVSAPEDDPEFYLHHDVYRDWNIYGAMFLDASVKGDLFCSDVATVFGHHMNDNSMGTMFANYIDSQWAEKHMKVLVQDPEHKVVYNVYGSRIINAEQTLKYASFSSFAKYKEWRDDAYSQCETTLSKPSCDRTLTLVTCSYTRFSNERTLSYCKPVKVDGEKIDEASCQVMLGSTHSEKEDAKMLREMQQRELENAKTVSKADSSGEIE